MRKKSSLIVALTILGVLTFSMVAIAGGRKAPGPNTQGVQVAQSADAPLTVNHALKKTYINSGFGTTLAAATFVPLDTPVGAVCPGLSGTCTLLVDAFATSGVDPSGGNRALCVAVNGSIVGACPYSGRSATDGSFSMFANSEQAISIPFGTSTVQTLAFSDTGASVYTFRVTYRVYKP